MKKKPFFRGPLAAALAKVYPSHTPTTIVRSLATDLLYQTGVRATGPPFDPFTIAKALNVAVSYESIEAEAVFSDDAKGVGKIILRKPTRAESQSYRRRLNFTLAHEIGHCVIRRTLIGFFPTSQFKNDDPEEESLCNSFAEELLMPTGTISKDLFDGGFAPDVLIDLTHKYQVSLRSLLCRATRLGRGNLVSAIWTKQDGTCSPDWTSPLSYKRMMLCDTGNTTVERAFTSRDMQCGRDDLILDGKRMKWQSHSKSLSQNYVLTVMHRTSDKSLNFFPKNQDLENRNFASGARVSKPTQQILPFGNLKEEY